MEEDNQELPKERTPAGWFETNVAELSDEELNKGIDAIIEFSKNDYWMGTGYDPQAKVNQMQAELDKRKIMAEESKTYGI